mgnify:FL=1
MTSETALANLAADTLYFGLDKLHALIHSLLVNATGTLERIDAAKRQQAQVSLLGYDGVFLVEDVGSTKVPLELRVSTLQLPATASSARAECAVPEATCRLLYCTRTFRFCAYSPYFERRLKLTLPPDFTSGLIN